MPKRRQPSAAAADPKRSRADAAAAAHAHAQPAAAAVPALVLQSRKQAPECEICNESLVSSEAAADAGGAVDPLRSRLPRLLPCGHSCCTSCIQKDLDLHGGQLKCLLCDFDPKQRLDSALKLPKNFTAIKLLETMADRDAMAEQRAAPPCQQCGPLQRRAAIVHCNGCGVNYCKQHNDAAHAMALLASHNRVSIAAHEAELSAAAQAQMVTALAAVAADSRRVAKAEEQKADMTMEAIKKRQEQLPQKLDALEGVVESTAKQLRAAADRLSGDFQQHRQSVTQATQQLADRAAALVPLRQTAQQVQQAGDFEANLLLAQLQRDSQRLYAQLQQSSAGARPTFGLDGLRELHALMPLSLAMCQSLILNVELAAKLAPMCKGLDLKAQPELLYRGSRDGFTRDEFVRCCANKGSTMTLVKVAGSGFIFGAYTHCSWPSVNNTVADPTGKSFLFSLANASGKAIRFSLREKDRAIELADCICFGASKRKGSKMTGFPNFVLMHKGQATDQKDANAANHTKDHDTPYQPDDGAVCDDTFLAGQHFFSAAEIEVFQLSD